MTELVLYQTLHLARGRIRHLAEHVAVLDAASRAVFARAYAPDIPHLAARIEALATAESYPQAVSGFVRIELTPAGDQRLLPAGVSLYDGYALRSLAPDAVTVNYDLPLSEAPTTLLEAADLLARCRARQQGADVAVRCDSLGQLRSAEGAPLFGIRKRRIIPSPAGEFPVVARDLVLRAAHAAGLAIDPHPLTCELLPSLDELFYADHRGITALAHCDTWPLMSLLSERIAGYMEKL